MKLCQRHVLIILMSMSLCCSASPTKRTLALIGGASILFAASHVASRLSNEPIDLDELIIQTRQVARGAGAAAGKILMQTSQHVPQAMPQFGFSPRLAVSAETVEREKPSLIERLQAMAEQRTWWSKKPKESAMLALGIIEVMKQKDSLLSQISDLEAEIRFQQTQIATGSLLWRITDVEERMKSAREGVMTYIDSPPFRTLHGYKLRLRIFPNGDGMGEGGYLSVILILMKGEFDSLAEWPFRDIVSINLKDQSPRVNLRKDHVQVFQPDINSSAFGRPVSDMNLGSGIPQFIPLKVLTPHNHNDFPDGGGWYVVDDTMYLQVIVTPPKNDNRKAMDIEPYSDQNQEFKNQPVEESILRSFKDMDAMDV